MNTAPQLTVNPLAMFNKENFKIYSRYIILAVAITCGMNLFHSIYVIDVVVSVPMFIVPTVAGIIFGFLIGKVQIMSNRHATLAATDALTQIYNRHIFDSIMISEMHRATRYKRPFSLIMFDIDRFKKVNDTYGHLVGDQVLKAIADLVGDLNRDSDIFARLGGEEFIILSAETDLAGAKKHAERLRAAMEKCEFETAGTVTCSFGVSEFRSQKDSTKTLIKRADDALYKAKEDGRNRVETE